MIFSYLLLFSTIYLVWTLNLYCLSYLIRRGYFQNELWTRSLRSSFLAPPFAIIILLFILLTCLFKKSLKSNSENLQLVMKKRV
jgi:hypothetical protein